MKALKKLLHARELSSILFLIALFLVVGLTDENFGSLTPDQMKTFEEKFHSPEVFIRMGRGIMAIPLPDEKVEKPQDKKLDAPELKPHKKVKEEAL